MTAGAVNGFGERITRIGGTAVQNPFNPFQKSVDSGPFQRNPILPVA